MFGHIQFDGAGWAPASIRATQILRCDPPDFRPILHTTTGPSRTWATPLEAIDWLSRDQTQTWYGFFSYDLGRWFEALPSTAIDDRRLPLFAFIAGEPIAPINPQDSPAAHVVATPTVSREAYESRIEQCLGYIRAGDVFQINLSQRFGVPLIESPAQIYARLQAKTPAKYAAFLDFGDFQLLSNSPELFLEQDPDRRVITRPIKGTRALRDFNHPRQSPWFPTNTSLTPARGASNTQPSIHRHDETAREVSPARHDDFFKHRNELSESIGNNQLAEGHSPRPQFETLRDPDPFTQQVLSHNPLASASRETGAIRTTPTNDPLTSSASVSAGKVLHESLKDAAELNMIIDLERNDLGRVCEIGSVRVTQTRAIETHPTVVHGVATIEGKLRRQSTFVDLLRATFPGGSITGAPKIRAMQIIDELEPHQRGPYCGAIGVIRPDGTHTFSIAIRTMVIHDGVVDVQVGGGIVADSKAGEEYEETLVKACAMFDALGVTAICET